VSRVGGGGAKGFMRDPSDGSHAGPDGWGVCQPVHIWRPLNTYICLLAFRASPSSLSLVPVPTYKLLSTTINPPSLTHPYPDTSSVTSTKARPGVARSSPITSRLPPPPNKATALTLLLYSSPLKSHSATMSVRTVKLTMINDLVRQLISAN
jgi:hypothetical protein